MSKRKSSNHPGWYKGGYVMLSTGTVVEILKNGEYVSTTSYGLWHYQIKFPDGRTTTYVPQIGDMPLGRCFQYLDKLRQSGDINMFGASSYVSREFNIDTAIAKKIVEEWMKTFSERHPKEA